MKYHRGALLDSKIWENVFKTNGTGLQYQELGNRPRYSQDPDQALTAWREYLSKNKQWPVASLILDGETWTATLHSPMTALRDHAQTNKTETITVAGADLALVICNALIETTDV